jgi:hypothetical protein
MAGGEGNRAPYDTNLFYAWKPKVTLLDRFRKYRLNLPVLFFDPIHWRAENERASIDHQDVIGHRRDTDLQLSTIAPECRLPVSHFPQSFKASYGMLVHQWIVGQRVE